MKIFGKELTFNGKRVYHEKDKPTPAEIGAAKSDHGHDAMTGATASAAGTAGFVPACRRSGRQISPERRNMESPAGHQVHPSNNQRKQAHPIRREIRAGPRLVC